MVPRNSDEAHCISDWGHDFRPDYRRIVRVLQRLPRNVPVLAATATANDRVVGDVHGQLGVDLRIQRGPLARESLCLQNLQMPNQVHRLAWLADHLDELPGSGIIYALTVRDALRVADWLGSEGHDVAAYYGAVPHEATNLDGAFAIEEALVRGEPVLLVDDVIDSGWTLTVIAALLREAGVSNVYPVVLASTGYQ